MIPRLGDTVVRSYGLLADTVAELMFDFAARKGGVFELGAFNGRNICLGATTHLEENNGRINSIIQDM